MGQTKFPLLVRWQMHQNDARHGAFFYFQSAIRKYGVSAFVIETLAICYTKKEANSLERLWILLLRSYDTTIGYNCTTGRSQHGKEELTSKLLRESRNYEKEIRELERKLNKLLRINKDDIYYQAEKGGIEILPLSEVREGQQELLYNTLLSKQVAALLDCLLTTLSHKQKDVISLRFGLEGKETSLKQVGVLLKISTERARQIEQEALRLLRRKGKNLVSICCVEKEISEETSYKREEELQRYASQLNQRESNATTNANPS